LARERLAPVASGLTRVGLPLLALLAGCAPKLPLEGRPCPCAQGYVCCESTHTCAAVTRGCPSDDAGTDTTPEASSADPPDGSSLDQAADLPVAPPDAGADAPSRPDAPDASTQLWTQMPAATPWPPAMGMSPLVYDSVHERAVLFGGGYRYDPGQGPQVFGDLWEWDGKTGVWQNRTPSPRPPEWPPPRFGHSLVFDARRGQVVVLGGWTYVDGAEVPVADIWEWDSGRGTWRSRDPASLPDKWPGSQFGAVAYDPNRGVVFMHDGPQRRTWEWIGSSGELRDRTPRAPALFPPAMGARAVYDPFRQRTLMVGWRPPESTTPEQPDLWEWNGDTGVWVDLRGSLGGGREPFGRRSFEIAFDEVNRTVVLFGGLREPQYRRDLWLWHAGAEGAEWIDRTPQTFSMPWPSGRSLHGMAYDGARARVILFGGGGQGGALDDLWELDPSR
jgi:hypothetical protein